MTTKTLFGWLDTKAFSETNTKDSIVQFQNTIGVLTDTSYNYYSPDQDSVLTIKYSKHNIKNFAPLTNKNLLKRFRRGILLPFNTYNPNIRDMFHSRVIISSIDIENKKAKINSVENGTFIIPLKHIVPLPFNKGLFELGDYVEPFFTRQYRHTVGNIYRVVSSRVENSDDGIRYQFSMIDNRGEEAIYNERDFKKVYK